MRFTIRPARRAVVRVLLALGGMVGAVAASGEPLSLVVDEDRPGASACEVDPDSTTAEYELGIACPPELFEAALGYEPVLTHTPAGWRYLKPAWAGGSCSGPIDDSGPFWDFTDACRTHDYGYDLVRLGMGSRPEADRQLFLDMMSSCRDQSFGARFGCRALARWTRVTLDIGESLRMDPAPVALAEPGRQRHYPFGSGFERVLMLGLVFGVLGLQVVNVRRVTRVPRRKESVMRRVLGTITLVSLGVSAAAAVVGFFAGAVVRSLGPCHATVGCIAAADVLLGLVMMAIVLGLPFGGWVGYRAARRLFDRVPPRITPIRPSAALRIASHSGR